MENPQEHQPLVLVSLVELNNKFQVNLVLDYLEEVEESKLNVTLQLLPCLKVVQQGSLVELVPVLVPSVLNPQLRRHHQLLAHLLLPNHQPSELKSSLHQAESGQKHQ